MNGDNTFEVDPRIIGKWKKNREIIEFETTGHYYSGRINNKYSISPDGNIMTIGSASLYYRVHNMGKGLVGTWRDEKGEEEVTYREDGFYVCLFSNEKIAYFGKWSCTETHFDSFEFRALVHTEDNRLYWRSYIHSPYFSVYEVSESVLRIHNPDGTVSEYERFVSLPEQSRTD